MPQKHSELLKKFQHVSKIFSLCTKIILFFYCMIQNNSGLLKNFRIAMLPCYLGFSLSGLCLTEKYHLMYNNVVAKPSHKVGVLCSLQAQEDFLFALLFHVVCLKSEELLELLWNKVGMNLWNLTVMLFNVVRKYDFIPKVKTDNREIFEVDTEVKLLGVIITSDLKGIVK